MPGKGVWAPRDQLSFSKAKMGAIGGAIGGAYLGSQGGDPFSAAAGAVVGMVVGHSIGETFDKIDQIHAAIVLKKALDNNPDGMYTNWKSDRKNMIVSARPVATNGTCREFTSDVTMNNSTKTISGTACKVNGEWEVK